MALACIVFTPWVLRLAGLTETYAIDIGFDRAADDLKLNYGEHLLKAAFAAYVREVEATWVSQG